MKKIFILCDMIHADVGGLARVVLNRSNLFEKEGYDVTILTIEPDKNYEDIANVLKKKGQLSDSIDIINIYEYYKEKNTKNSFIKKIANRIKYYSKTSKLHEFGYQIIDEYENKKYVRYLKNDTYIKFKKWRKGGSLKYIDYFNENGIRINRNHYLHGFLTKEIFYENNRVTQKKYFTTDGFCYLIEIFNTNGKRLKFLFNRKNNKIATFTSEYEFHKHFLTELCKSCSEKPYLICDGSGPTPLISNIDPKVAYRISKLHSNPYTGPYCFGSPMRDIGVLNSLEKLDAFVTITEKQRKDIIKEFGDHGNTYVIPNFVLKNESLNLEKNPNKISIFGRFSHEKNVIDAVKSFKIVTKERDDAILEIFGRALLPGERNELKKVKKLIKKLGLENNVFIKGYTNDVDKEMSESVATLLTSKFEGFGLVIIESMLNSTPVISYDINYGPSDIIDHGVDGFLVEPDNTKEMAKYILELLNDTGKAKKMGILARKKVLKRFNEENTINQWNNLFDIISKR